MKILIASFALALLTIGCGSGGEKPNETAKINTTPAPASAPNTAVPNANQAANNYSQMPKSGEKIEQVYEINFGDGLPKGWEALDPEKENPSGFAFSGTGLKLKIPTGKDLFGENMTAPRLTKSVSGDFEIETRIRFSPAESYQGAGLLIFRNDNNYLRLERGYGGTRGGESGIRFDKREDEVYEPVATPDEFPTAAGEVELKFRRNGREFTAFWREAGKPVWIEVGKVTNNYPDAVQVGLIGVNTADEITAEFVSLRLLPAAAK